MSPRFSLRFLLLLALTSTTTVHASDLKCAQYRSALLSKRVEYCIQRTQTDRPASGEPVFYFMHGIFGDARRWRSNRYDESLRKLASEEGFPAASFVTFDTSALSYFIDRADKPRLAFQRWFIEEFIPFIEARAGVCSRRECRGLIGNSMGGLGALHTALRFPQLFGLVAVNSPALLPFNIFEPWEDWKAYIDRHPLSTMKGKFFLDHSREAFGSRENFDAHDPSWIMAHAWDGSRPFPQLFMDVGGKDSWGFWEGFFRLRSVLQSRGLDFESHFEPEGIHKIEAQPLRRERLLRFVQRFTERWSQIQD
jgi:pimeloyl-ACP methyl ester carboxylesterase